jgi:hypothetical protein
MVATTPVSPQIAAKVQLPTRRKRSRRPLENMSIDSIITHRYRNVSTSMIQISASKALRPLTSPAQISPASAR